MSERAFVLSLEKHTGVLCQARKALQLIIVLVEEWIYIVRLANSSQVKGALASSVLAFLEFLSSSSATTNYWCVSRPSCRSYRFEQRFVRLGLNRIARAYLEVPVHECVYCCLQEFSYFVLSNHTRGAAPTSRGN